MWYESRVATGNLFSLFIPPKKKEKWAEERGSRVNEENVKEMKTLRDFTSLSPPFWCVCWFSLSNQQVTLWVAFKSHIKIYAAFLVFCMLSAFYIHCSSSHISSNLSLSLARLPRRNREAKKFDFIAPHHHILSAVACRRLLPSFKPHWVSSFFFNILQCVFVIVDYMATHKF